VTHTHRGNRIGNTPGSRRFNLASQVVHHVLRCPARGASKPGKRWFLEGAMLPKVPQGASAAPKVATSGNSGSAVYRRSPHCFARRDCEDAMFHCGIRPRRGASAVARSPGRGRRRRGTTTAAAGATRGARRCAGPRAGGRAARRRRAGSRGRGRGLARVRRAASRSRAAPGADAGAASAVVVAVVGAKDSEQESTA